MRAGGQGGSQAWTARWVGIRIGLVAAVLAAAFGAVGFRAFQLQVLRPPPEARDYLSELTLRPRRGTITDRNGNALAASADAKSAYLDPALFFQSWQEPRLRPGEKPPTEPPPLTAAERRQREAMLRKIARLTGQDPEALLQKAAKGGRFVWIARRMLPDREKALADWLKAERPRGVALTAEARRYYPKLELASQVLGLVNDDDAGIEGIELALDDRLQGAAGEVPALRDGRGGLAMAEAPGPAREREGDRVELTLDQGMQATAERALSRAVTSSRALAGMAVVLDPRTGEILALASWPVPNPNAPRTIEQLRNHPVTDAFEPGSTVKTFSIAAALQAGALRPTDAIDCGNGVLQVGDKTIHDHAALGWTGASRIVAQSSNVGAARIALRLGREKLREGLAAFGFGEKTGVELPGEARGQLPLAPTTVGLATQAFGQGPITASALQVTSAMATIAAGGVRLRPHIVRRVIEAATGAVVEQAQPEVLGRAVSAEVAATMTRWLVGVIEDPKGTGRRAALDGWRAAGKTGTAQKVDASGGYSRDRHLSSFVGFAPVEAPRVVVGVFLDEPRGEYYGGEVAAPAFKEIAEYALRALEVQPAPAAARVAAAAPASGAASEPARAEDEGGEAAAVDDPPAAEGADGSRVTVPALAGLPARTAVRTLELSGLTAALRGSGRVVEQSPPPGRAVGRGSLVRVRLGPSDRSP